MAETYTDAEFKRNAFWEKVRATLKPGECWHWEKSDPSEAQRFSYEFSRGELLAPGAEVSALCDSQTCVKPAHLTIVEKAEASDVACNTQQEAKGQVIHFPVTLEMRIRLINREAD